MSGYATRSPVVERGTDDAGTTTSDMLALPSGQNHSARGPERLPAFLALAKQTGGVYAENQAGMTVEQALTAADLDFTVSLHEFGTMLEDPSSNNLAPTTWVPGVDKMRNVIATSRKGRRRSMGVAGKGYKPVQPRQAAQFGQAVLEEGGATVVAAAGYGDPQGSRMYLALKMPEGIKVGGQDAHDLYLTIGNSFNRETGLWGCVAPIRIACTNQAAATFGKFSNRFILRHTGDMEGKVSEVQYALKLTNGFAEQYALFAEKMLGQRMFGTEIDNFLEKVLATPARVATDRGEEQWADRRREVKTIITSGDNNEFGRGTRYAAYQGVAEWADWRSKANTDLGRYTRLVDGGEVENIKIRAASLLMSGV